MVEWTATGAVCGPGQVGGLHYGTNYLYCRINGEPWFRPVSRTAHKLLFSIELADNRKDFEELECQAR